MKKGKEEKEEEDEEKKRSITISNVMEQIEPFSLYAHMDTEGWL